MNGTEIAAAFNTMNDKKHWSARAIVRERKGELTDVVHFEARSGMIALAYNVIDGRFAVVFNKYHGAWGDYIKAIARSLFVVLNTLKAGGLPFEAPSSLAGMIIEAVTTDDNTVYVRWPGDTIRGHSVTFAATDELRQPNAMEGLDRLTAADIYHANYAGNEELPGEPAICLDCAHNGALCDTHGPAVLTAPLTLSGALPDII